jgi:hypothetical protein
MTLYLLNFNSSDRLRSKNSVYAKQALERVLRTVWCSRILWKRVHTGSDFFFVHVNIHKLHNAVCAPALEWLTQSSFKRSPQYTLHNKSLHAQNDEINSDT